MKARHDLINQLKFYRLKDSDLTQEQLAERIGVTRQTILSIEKGRYTPSVALALRMAAVLNCTVEDLFQLKGDDDG
jgi:putative transcriptional regulator